LKIASLLFSNSFASIRRTNDRQPSAVCSGFIVLKRERRSDFYLIA
jgi:hypothetical protein